MGNIAESPQRTGWPDFSRFRPHPSGTALSAWLRETQGLTDTLFSVIDAARLDVPKIRIVNPPLWEIGHVGWFQEFWIHRGGSFESASMIEGADALYDSARVHHHPAFGGHRGH